MTFRDHQLSVSFAKAPIETTPTERIEDPCKIKVTGIPLECDEESLYLFFENKRHSGGGEIQTCEMDHALGEALITFVNSQGEPWNKSPCNFFLSKLFLHCKQLMLAITSFVPHYASSYTCMLVCIVTKFMNRIPEGN